MPIKPITPKQVDKEKSSQFPDFVIESFNHLIAKNWDGDCSVIEQDEVITLILARAPGGIDRASVFDNHWLDVERFYEKAGWNVEYDKPAYSESYKAHFIFRK